MTDDLDPERRLALAYVPASRRAAVAALWRLDVALGAVLATGREPMISRIRLAWWRESLEKLDREPPPAEPMLVAIAEQLVPAGLAGAELAAMEGGWSRLADPDPLTPDDLEAYSRHRGGALFDLSARLLGGGDDIAVAAAGEAWALVDLARRSTDAGEAAAAVAAARRRALPRRWPAALRPLGMLAMLAERDAAAAPAWERQGSPGRVWRMLRHRMTGR